MPTLDEIKETWSRENQLYFIVYRQGNNSVHISRSNGAVFWLNQKKLHNEEGPAVQYPDGTEMWLQHGKLHRHDGPAIVKPKENQEEWWCWGKNGRPEEIPPEERNFELPPVPTRAPVERRPMPTKPSLPPIEIDQCADIPDWDAGFAYEEPGTMVKLNGFIYRLLKKNSGKSPESNSGIKTFWEMIGNC